MAIALVQSTKKVIGGVSDTTLAFGSALTGGNLVVVSQSHYSNPAADISTPTDTLTQTYVGVTAQQFINEVGSPRLKLRSFYVENCAGGADTVTFDIGGATTGDITAVISEWSGVVTSSALASGNVGTGASTTPSSGSVTPGADGALFYGAMIYDGGDTTIAPDASWTGTLQENEGGTSSMPIGTQYWIQPTAAADDGDWTIGASRNWAAHVGLFTAATGAAGGLPGLVGRAFHLAGPRGLAG